MASCEAEYGKNIEWACSHCPKKKPEDIDPYTFKMLHIFNMSQAGYPYSANDLTVDEWLDLGRVKAILNPHHCPFMGAKS